MKFTEKKIPLFPTRSCYLYSTSSCTSFPRYGAECIFFSHNDLFTHKNIQCGTSLNCMALTTLIHVFCMADKMRFLSLLAHLRAQ